MSELPARPKPQVTVEPMTEADLKSELMGSVGDPTYQQQYGITSTPLGEPAIVPTKSVAELELEADQAHARAINPVENTFRVTPVVDDLTLQLEGLNGQIAEYKAKYGNSENEKGELRRQLEELTAAFNGVLAQIQEQQLYGQGGNGTGYYSPPAQYASQVGYPQPAIDPNYDPFADIPDSDYLDGKTFKSSIRDAVAPLVLGFQQQAVLAQQRAAQLERQLVMQAKVSSGIRPIDEYRLAAKHPWLKGLPEASRVQAMASLVAQERQQGVYAPQPATTTTQPSHAVAQVPPSPTPGQERIVSRVTHIENQRPQTSDNAQAALEAAYNRDVAKVMALPTETGERARGFRELAKKYNMAFTTPSDLAR